MECCHLHVCMYCALYEEGDFFFFFFPFPFTFPMSMCDFLYDVDMAFCDVLIPSFPIRSSLTPQRNRKTLFLKGNI